MWASLHDGRLLFSSFQSNNASVLDLFNKKKKSRLARGSAADNTSPQSSYISNMVGSFFSQRGAGDATSSRSGSAVGGKDKLKGGQCGKRCFGYLDLLANSGCQLKVLSSEFLITGRNRDGQTKHDRLFGFQLCEGDFSIVFATATEKERRDWLSKVPIHYAS